MTTLALSVLAQWRALLKQSYSTRQRAVDAVLPNVYAGYLSPGGIWTWNPSRRNRTKPVPTSNHCCHTGRWGGLRRSGLFLWGRYSSRKGLLNRFSWLFLEHYNDGYTQDKPSAWEGRSRAYPTLVPTPAIDRVASCKRVGTYGSRLIKAVIGWRPKQNFLSLDWGGKWCNDCFPRSTV